MLICSLLARRSDFALRIANKLAYLQRKCILRKLTKKKVPRFGRKSSQPLSSRHVTHLPQKGGALRDETRTAAKETSVYRVIKGTFSIARKYISSHVRT